MEQLVCLIVGDTPSTQLLSWRLSLSNCFIVLVSNSLSSDGLISWKSTKLGSNFYKPNLTSKDLKSLPSNSSVGKFDIIVLSCHSISEYITQLEALERFIHDDTVIIIDSNFAVELELVSLARYPNVTTVSVIVDAEVRRLSIGSYLLINDSNSFKFGITYSNKTKEPILKENITRFSTYLKKNNSKFKLMLQLLERTNIGSVEVIAPEDESFGLHVWEWLLPRISLNVLSIVFEQVSYAELLNNESNTKVFRQLVKELMEICYKQTNGGVIDCFVFNNDRTTPDYNSILQRLQDRQRDLERFTKGEYPEYLTLNYEAYCFYHRIEFPSSLMFNQCIDVAEKYGCANGNLTFLSGFYSRLLNLSGVQINNDESSDLKKPNLLWGKKSVLNVDQKKSTNQSSQKKVKVKSKKFSLHSKVKTPHASQRVPATSGYKSPDLQLPPELQEMYLGCDSLNFSSPLSPKIIDVEFDSTSDDNVESTESDEESNDESVYVEKVKKEVVSERSMVKLSEQMEHHEDDDNIDPSLKLPLFKGFKNTTQRPMTTGRLQMTDLEWQIRNGYVDIPRQMMLVTKNELREPDDKMHHTIVGQYWKLIKQQHMNNGQLIRPITSQEDILRFHCETLKKAQVHLSTTTNRYGDLDFSDSVYEHWTHGKGCLYKLLSDR